MVVRIFSQNSLLSLHPIENYQESSMYMETNQTPQVDFQLGSESVSVNGENSEIRKLRKMKSKFSYLVILILLSFSLSETKIGYIYSIEIMNNYEEVRQMNIELEKEQKRLESLYKKKMSSYYFANL